MDFLLGGEGVHDLSIEYVVLYIIGEFSRKTQARKRQEERKKKPIIGEKFSWLACYSACAYTYSTAVASELRAFPIPGAAMIL